MFEAQGSIITGFTATPARDKGSQIADMINEIKGTQDRDKIENGGYVSYFNILDENLYPKTEPGPPLLVMPIIHKIELGGHNLTKYDQVRKKKDTTMTKLTNYCNMGSTYGFRNDFGARLLAHPYLKPLKLLQCLTT